ncbi:MAG TPA: hypothetical protein VGC13_22865 [Longimicrobium sp.]|jgi:hypothetical protein|uniref:hypothetical protein n=1 Tax=Longimicrobium sp. TaxID=2029185 RepID=UPI002ED96683
MAAALALAACGGGDDGAVVEGTFHPGLAATGVWVVESERSEPADSSGFRLADLTPGPVSLRLMRGSDTAAVLNVSGLGPGMRLALQGLRVDAESGLAFPRSVELDGGPVVTVNGLRMAPAGRVPREVDARGAVLAWSSDVGALLLRPDDARLPDLRVVVGPSTQVVGTDGGGADATTLEPGDSLRVEGRFEEGYVLATRLTLPTRIGAAAGDDVEADEGDPGTSAESFREGDGGGGAAAPLSISRIPASREAPRGGNGNARGRDEEWRKEEQKRREEARRNQEERRRDAEKGKGKGREKKNKG